MVADPRNTVRVRGANVPQNLQEPPPQPPRPGFLGWIDTLRDNWRSNSEAMQESGMSGPPGLGSPDPFEQAASERAADWWMSKEPRQNPVLDAYSNTQLPPAGTTGVMGGRGYIPGQTTPMDMSAEEVPAGLTFQEWAAANMGTFDESPYRNYMDFLATQDAETMARINALYNELAGEAQANMERIRDIYGSAQMTSGDVYGSAAQNIEGAYGSAQQQAADQMARLGIEAAAPAVINPMALSQAEAVAGVESAGAGALDALTRYGASAQDFGSQMGQVAQQQGLEVSNQILRDMAQRQAEAAFQMEQARANYNPYANALQQLEAEQLYNQVRGTEPSIEEQRLTFEMLEAQAKGQLEYQRWKRDTFVELTTPQNGARPMMTPEEAQQYLDALEQMIPGY